MKRTARNVLGGPLATCSTNPITGFWRDGCCQTGDEDLGIHTICARVTAEFLSFSRRRGNDLSTPRPSTASRASSRATSGASAPPGGKRRSRPALRRRAR